tara:strand:+ start:1075 stop:1287 length:213 start_codon:yes stop_codon:yes gene_type:complete
MTRNNNYIICFLSEDEDNILEPLATFSGDVIYFKTEIDARDYIDRLLDRNDMSGVKPFEDNEALQILRVQ